MISAFFRHHHCIRETSKCSDTKWDVFNSVSAEVRSSTLSRTCPGFQFKGAGK